MNIHKAQLLEKYREAILEAPPAERSKCREKFLGLAVRYLNGADPQLRLLEAASDILTTIINLRKSIDMSEVGNFFRMFETYAVNLLDCPWKREFRKITMYSGFYKTKIEPVAKDAWKLMQLIGYEQVGMCLELKKVPIATKLQEVAFEFFLASVECSFLAEIFEKVNANGGFTRKEIYDCRRKTQGDAEVLLTALRTIRSGGEKPDDGDHLQFKGRGIDASSKLPFIDSEEQFHHKAIDKIENLEIAPPYAFAVDKMKLSSRKTSEILAGLHSESDGDVCEKKTESIEAMLQAITPEMISDASIRKQILLKLQPAGETISLPPFPDPTVKRDPPAARPNTEPIHIPPGRERSRTSQDTDRNAIRGHTEPLVEPKRSSKSHGIDLTWQCVYCSFANKEVISKRTQTCSTCGRPRKDV